MIPQMPNKWTSAGSPSLSQSARQGTIFFQSAEECSGQLHTGIICCAWCCTMLVSRKSSNFPDPVRFSACKGRAIRLQAMVHHCMQRAP